jgi:creatinine amidohydrolase
MLITTATSRDEGERSARVAVLPVGSFEQHGTFLPLATDTIVACVLSHRVSTEHGLFLLPPVTISCSHEHSAFAGTVSIGARTLIAVVDDVRASLRRSNVDRLVLVNGHGGNYVLSNIAQEANVSGAAVTVFPTRPDWDAARAAGGLATNGSDDMHAGELEVSIMLHAYPELVGGEYSGADAHASPRPHLLVTGIRGYSESGVIGRPSLASAQKGRAVLDKLAEQFKEHLALLA